MDRREFLKTAGVGSLSSAVARPPQAVQVGSASEGDRHVWVDLPRRLADPVLNSLRIGFCGHQPGIGETYISTGSLYLCSVVLLPLGLRPADLFWSAPPQPWTSVRAWSGQAFPIDHALAP